MRFSVDIDLEYCKSIESEEITFKTKELMEKYKMFNINLIRLSIGSLIF